MNQILRFLFDNPILIMILVGWLFSALAGAATKAAKRQAQPRSRPRPEFDALRKEQREAERTRQAEQAGQAEQGGRSTSARTGPAEGAPRGPEEIARQLREMLGLEPGPERTRSPAPAVEPERRQPRERDLGDEETIHVPTVPVGQLRKDLKRKRAEQHALSQVGKKPVAVVLRHRTSRRSGARIAFDRKHAIAAVIGMEVLGPPRALRAYRGPGEEQQ